MRLLLDAHLSPALAEQLRRHGLDVVGLQDWMGGQYLKARDDSILAIAYQDHRILVTCDCHTIPSLLKEWAESGRYHAGVVLVNGKRLRPDNVGGLLRALLRLAEARGHEDWQDRSLYLQPE